MTTAAGCPVADDQNSMSAGTVADAGCSPHGKTGPIHSQKHHPVTDLRDATTQWDFWSLSPESLHQVTWLSGDRGLPATLRHIDGFGSHTFSLWNGEER